jgi:hypothetical protein
MPLLKENHTFDSCEWAECFLWYFARRSEAREEVSRMHAAIPKRSERSRCPSFIFPTPFISAAPFYIASRPDIPRNGFPEKWKARRFPPGMAKYEIVRRCSHRRKTSVGYWGRDYSTLYTHTHTRARAHTCEYTRIRVFTASCRSRIPLSGCISGSSKYESLIDRTFSRGRSRASATGSVSTLVRSVQSRRVFLFVSRARE